MTKQTITLTIRPAQYGWNPNGFSCVHENTYDGAPDSHHPVGMGNTPSEAIANWLEGADLRHDGDLTDYLEQS